MRKMVLDRIASNPISAVGGEMVVEVTAESSSSTPKTRGVVHGRFRADNRGRGSHQPGVEHRSRRAADPRWRRITGGPYLAALVAAFWVAWGLVFGGIAELISAFSSSENRLWKVLLALLYVALGIYILRNPESGLVALALTLAYVFLVKGVISILGALQLRPERGWVWWLADGIVTLLLAVLIYSGWPQDSMQIIALLVGISLIMSGVNRVVWALSH
jgi:uncharacterized membrane protein HdeD (DUF308 family)